MDRGHAWSVTVGAVCTYCRRHQQWRRGVHVLPGRAAQAAVQALTYHSPQPGWIPRADCIFFLRVYERGYTSLMKKPHKTGQNPGPSEVRPTIMATASGCVTASARPAPNR